jgi:hypothetical protein
MVLVQFDSILSGNQRSKRFVQNNQTLAETFDQVLVACYLAFLVLTKRLDELVEFEQDEGRKMGRISKLKMAYNEQEMQNLLQNIQGQSSGLNLVLSVLTMLVFRSALYF